MQITLNVAQNIVNTLNAKQANTSSNINLATVTNALSSVKSTTFATLTQASKVTLNAQLKTLNYYKITVQNVTLCNSSASIYTNAVNKQLNAQDVQAQVFKAVASNYTQINNSYSVVALKSNTNKHYLQAIVNNCLQSVYYCASTNTFVSKQHIANYLSANASAKFLNTSKATTVQHANVTHTVTARTFALANIYNINVNKQSLTA